MVCSQEKSTELHLEVSILKYFINFWKHLDAMTMQFKNLAIEKWIVKIFTVYDIQSLQEISTFKNLSRIDEANCIRFIGPTIILVLDNSSNVNQKTRPYKSFFSFLSWTLCILQYLSNLGPSHGTTTGCFELHRNTISTVRYTANISSVYKAETEKSILYEKRKVIAIVMEVYDLILEMKKG